jgi:hypothetical protein
VSTASFTKVDYPLTSLIEAIENGTIGLPDIQRPFVWTPAQVRDLFDSMYKGFPVGYLLFWINDQSTGGRQIGVSSSQAKVPRLLIVDGQQRLTSLYAVFKGIPVLDKNYNNLSIQIAFRPRDAKFEVADAAIRRDPEFIPDISQLWTEQKTSYRAITNFLGKLRQHHEVAAQKITDEEERQISSAIDGLFDLQRYPFTAMEIASKVSEEQVADIFVRINSKGVQLRQADFILTLLSVFWDEGRAALELFSRESHTPAATGKPSSFNYYIAPAPDQLLRTAVAVGFRRARLQYVYSILRGKDLDTGEFSDDRRIEQFEKLKIAQSYVLNLNNWHDFLRALTTAGYRGRSMITSEMGVIYAYAMYLIGKYDFHVDQTILRSIIARWFFMTAITASYSGSPETTMDEDLARLRGLSNAEDFVNALGRVIENELTNDFWNITLPNTLETSAARSPYLFAYYAALNLLDARVLFSRMRVSDLLDPAIKPTRNSLERHHLFPKAYLKGKGYESVNEMNQVANFALVEWGDNTKIADQPPSCYFPKYSARYSPEEMRQMMWWHALPDQWHEMEYVDFLARRRKMMAEVTRRGFETLLPKVSTHFLARFEP